MPVQSILAPTTGRRNTEKNARGKRLPYFRVFRNERLVSGNLPYAEE